jgi:hypothetical protein
VVWERTREKKDRENSQKPSRTVMCSTASSLQGRILQTGSSPQGKEREKVRENRIRISPEGKLVSNDAVARGRGENGEEETHELLVVHRLDSLVSRGLLSEGDETETTGAASSGLAVFAEGGQYAVESVQRG